MKNYRILNTKSVVLDKFQLEKYLENLASDHVLKEKSDKNTYPIPRMQENFEIITTVYNLLNEHIKLKIPIHSAGEWLLDNFYVIEETVKSIEKELTLKKYTNFLGIANGVNYGFARIYVLATEIVSYTDSNITSDLLTELLKSYQEKKKLNMEEIWNIGIFLQIALIENIRNICERIYSAELQKYKVENIIERLVENKAKDELKFNKLNEYKTRVKEYGEMKYPFIEYMSFRLKSYGKKAFPFLNILEEQVNKMGIEVSEVIKKEHFDIAVKKVSMGNCITSIKAIQRINFINIFEEINQVDEILKQDPAQVYDKMDYKTKIYYRNAIKELSKKTKISEIYIAKKCLELCQGKAGKQAHIGYYLIDRGNSQLLKILQGKEAKKCSNNKKLSIYILTKIIVSLMIAILLGLYIYRQTGTVWSLVLTIILTYIPIEIIFTQIVQYISNKVVKPRLIPKMDFQNGIPKESATFVVIPTIITSKEKIDEMMKKLEVYYIANKSENLYFALLGDVSASSKEEENFDEEIANYGIEITKKLNEKYRNNKPNGAFSNNDLMQNLDKNNMYSNNKNIKNNEYNITEAKLNADFPKFHFLYRKRIWNEKEECYLGWERKRGLLTQFNEYILKNSKDEFKVNTIDLEKVPKIKYVITLDADTELVLNTGLELVGAMAHILNKPEIEAGAVRNGYGIIAPRVGIGLVQANKSNFTRIYSSLPGTDSYTNAISDVYQDNFAEGIYTGKGIYDLEVFSEVLKNEIPDNTVLSHDLLEGSYLKCGLASDIMLMDGFPTSYMAYKTRTSRWVRGDWQILGWLFKKIQDKNGNKKKNPLNLVSKYKILNNLVRSTFEIFVLVAITFLLILHGLKGVSIWPVMAVLISSVIISSIIEIVNKIVYKKDGEVHQKTFYKSISGIKTSFIRGILELGLLPDKAYAMTKSISKTLYRMFISKKHMLEWTTAEEAEKNQMANLLEYNKNMWFNLFCGLILILYTVTLMLGVNCRLAYWGNSYTSKIFNGGNILLLTLGILWVITPSVINYISKKQKEEMAIDYLMPSEKDYLMEIGKKTWSFFKEYITEKSNYLPPDNYQEDRKEQVVYRTSPTNIGLGLLAVVSSYDLGYENIENTIDLLYKMLNTILKLQKWNGHLYNWYDLKTLEPLNPKYVSTVDSGNFIGYLYVLKQFLEEVKQGSCERCIANLEKNNYMQKVFVEVNKQKCINNIESDNNKTPKIIVNDSIKNQINQMLEIINTTIENTNFSYLYSKVNQIFSIGFNVEEGALTKSYYDLLASEARQASLVAIAKKDVTPKHWYTLSRTLTTLNKYKGLISWSGTMFEYLMPNINIPNYPGSIISESSEFAILSQQEYAKKLNIPWGISEAAFNLRDLNNNYQYKAFGIPWLGLKRGLADEMVVASYGTVLALNDAPFDTVSNLKKLEKQGMYGKYGFYESIDFTPSRLKKNDKNAVIKTYMAHHQGLILLSINNLFNKNILQKRFMKNPEIESVEILLEERMPENVIITKEQKEKVEKVNNVDYETYVVREYNKPYDKLKNINLISSEDYLVVMDQKGNGYSKYKDIVINRFKKTDDEEQGIFFFFKNIKTKRIWSSGQRNYLGKADKYSVQFMPEMCKFVRQDGGIETVTKTFVLPNSPVEIRRIELKNLGNTEETIEVSSFLEPVLSSLEQDYSHKAFNNLFITFEILQNTNTIVVKRKQRDNSKKDIYLAVNLYTEHPIIGDLEYELDKLKFVGRQNIELPVAIENSIPLSSKCKTSLDPIVAMRKTINIKPSEKVVFNYIMAISEDKEEAINLVTENLNEEKILQNMNLAKVKTEAESLYLGIRATEIEVYQKMLAYLIYQNPLKLLMYKDQIPPEAPTTELWKYGISGDLPILLVTIKDVTDITVVKEALKAYEYYKVKNIKIDLVILNEEKKTYENYLQEEIQNAILDKGLGYMQNVKGGIYLIQGSIEKKSKQILEFRSNVLINASLGSIGRQLKDYEEEYIETLKEIPLDEQNINLEEEKLQTPLDANNLKYCNEYGGFSKDGTEYCIRVNKDEKLPTVWSNIMANENFGTVVTEGLGGYTWYKNSRLRKAYSME